MNYRISIIIPVFNKFKYTLNALNSLFNLPNDCQIIVVDNNSTDDTCKELLKINKESFVYFKLSENIGFGGACNKGYSLAQAPIVMFLNNDIKVEKNYNQWIDEIINFLHNNPNYLVGPTGGYINPKRDFHFEYETNDPNKLINYMSGWCLSATKETFNQLVLDNCEGPFDSINFKMYYEDNDLSFRAKEKNIKFKLINIPVKHYGKISSDKSQISYLYNKSRQIFLNKWKK